MSFYRVSSSFFPLLVFVLFSSFGILRAQITPSCPAPGTAATLTWSDPAHPSAFARIERDPDSSGVIQQYEYAFTNLGLQQSPTTTNGTATLAAAPGVWLGYYVQDSPYWQSPPVNFTCAAQPVIPTVQTIAGAWAIGYGLWAVQPPGQPATVSVDFTVLGELVAAPKSSNDPCRKTQFAFDGQFLYVCVAQNTWRHVGFSP